MRERFRDGASILSEYEFAINHWTEQPDDQRRSIQRTAPTSGTGFVRQQGDSSPQVLKYGGTIMTQAQKDAMQAYYEACNTRTVFFREYTGVEHEVVITGFSVTRVPVLWNSRDTSLKHIWRYDLEMEVIA